MRVEKEKLKREKGGRGWAKAHMKDHSSKVVKGEVGGVGEVWLSGK
jgi:hypothetical protein